MDNLECYNCGTIPYEDDGDGCCDCCGEEGPGVPTRAAFSAQVATLTAERDALRRVVVRATPLAVFAAHKHEDHATAQVRDALDPVALRSVGMEAEAAAVEAAKGAP